MAYSRRGSFCDDLLKCCGHPSTRSLSVQQQVQRITIKSGCDSIKTLGSAPSFLACNGVFESDAQSAYLIVSIALLGALPMAAWSSTFRASSRKPIFLLWFFLLSISHIFYNLVISDVNHHFQICPRHRTEKPPGIDYQAPLLDIDWTSSFYTLLSGQDTPQSVGNVNGTVDFWCLYSCFASDAYTGRTPREVGVYEASAPAHDRWGAVTIWWAYIALSLIIFFTAERPELLPRIAHRTLFTFRHPSLRIVWSKSSSRNHHQRLQQINAITILSLVTQVLSAAAFIGTIIYIEASTRPFRTNVNVEKLSAVGQWGGVAVVVQVLIAAGVSYLWKIIKPEEMDEAESVTQKPEEELEEGIWDCRVGYAA